MKTGKYKVLINLFFLSGLSCAGYVAAQDNIYPPAPPQSNQSEHPHPGAGKADKPPMLPPQDPAAIDAPPVVVPVMPPAHIKPGEVAANGRGTVSKQLDVVPGIAPAPKDIGSQKQHHAPAADAKQPSSDKHAPSVDTKQPSPDKRAPEKKVKIKKQPYTGPVILDTDFSDDAAGPLDPSSLPDFAEIEKKLKSIPPLPPNIKQYLEDKYVRLADLPSVHLQMTPYGQQIESIHIRGDITPRDEAKAEKFWKAKNEPSREERARALAMAFLEEEAGLLGIIDMREINEKKISVNEYGTGYIDIYYERKIGNVELEYSFINVGIGPNDIVTNLTVNVIHVTPELYHALRKPTLKKREIYEIVKQDVKKSLGPDTELRIFTGFKKVAIPKPPYVVWKGRGGAWEYRIDAFTGEILKKQDTDQPFRQK
ncbi:MAG: hypothetical protein OEV28_02970 [Nitrospirota bacterium]|nr:hypothetical protein [Nitrospirota bacterium]